MGRYVEKRLYEDELIVVKAKRDGWSLVGKWVLGILFFWLLFIPLIKAIAATVEFSCTELVVTNKRIIRKEGVFHTKAHDIPLNKIQNVYVETTFWGRVFNTNKIRIIATGIQMVDQIEDADKFKSMILDQVDQYEEARLARQAKWTAQAMSTRMNMQAEAEQQSTKKSKGRDKYA